MTLWALAVVKGRHYCVLYFGRSDCYTLMRRLRREVMRALPVVYLPTLGTAAAAAGSAGPGPPLEQLGFRAGAQWYKYQCQSVAGKVAVAASDVPEAVQAAAAAAKRVGAVAGSEGGLRGGDVVGGKMGGAQGDVFGRSDQVRGIDRGGVTRNTMGLGFEGLGFVPFKCNKLTLGILSDTRAYTRRLHSQPSGEVTPRVNT
jgi:hypothetical protein